MLTITPPVVNSARIDNKDPESQQVSSQSQRQQTRQVRNLKKGAMALVCAAAAGTTLRALTAHHMANPTNHNTARILMPDTGNSTCPEGFSRFNKAASLKAAKLGAGIGFGLIPGIGIVGAGATVQFLKMDYECAAMTALGVSIAGGVGSFASIPIAALLLHAATTIKDGTCLEKSKNTLNTGGRG